MADDGELHRDKMTDDQRACHDVLCRVFYGEHHVPTVRAFGRGIRVSVYSGQLATFDFDYLTRLVVISHDECVRAEIMQSGPGRVGVALFKRHAREGTMASRHPTLEQAAAGIRANERPKG